MRSWSGAHRAAMRSQPAAMRSQPAAMRSNPSIIRWRLVVVCFILHICGVVAIAPVYVFLNEADADLRQVLQQRTNQMRSRGFPVSTNTILVNRTNLYSSILTAHKNPDSWSAILDLTSSRACVLYEVAATRGRPFLSINDNRCYLKGQPAATTITPPDQQYLDAVTSVVQRTNITVKPIHVAIFYDDAFDGTIISGEDGWEMTVFYFLYRLTPSVNDTRRLLLNLRKDVDVYTFIVLAKPRTAEVLLEQAAELQMLGTMGVYYRWFVVTKVEKQIFCPKCSGTDVIHLHHVVRDKNSLEEIYKTLTGTNTTFSLVKSVYAYDSLMTIYNYLLLANNRDPNSTPKNETNLFPYYLLKEHYNGIYGLVGVTEKTLDPALFLSIDKLSKGFNQKVGHWSSKNGMTLTSQLFPTDQRRPVLRVLTTPEVPFVITEAVEDEGGEQTLNFTGYTLDVLERVADAVPFDYKLILLEELDKRHPHLTLYDEMVKLLADGAVDMIAATLSVTLKRSEMVDFTIPYYDYAGIQILTKKPAQNKNLFNFLTVFSWQVWVTIAGTLVLMTLLVHVLDRLSPFSYRNRRHVYAEGGKVYTVKESAWFVMGSFTKSGEGDSPKACSSRLLVAGFWFFCMVIMATFTANLAAFLTASRLNTPVASLDELAQQNRMNYSVVSGHDAAGYFEHMSDIEDTFYDRWKEMSLGPEKGGESQPQSQDKSYQYAVWDYPLGDKFTKIWKHIKDTGFFNTTQQGIEKVENDENFAFLHMAPVLKYVAGLNCDLTVVGDQFSNKPFAFALQKNSPLTSEISDRILKLQRDSKLEEIKLRWILKLQRDRQLEEIKLRWWEQTKRPCPKEDDVNTGITMETVGGVFIAMTIGIGLCLIALAVEVSCTKYRRPKTATVSMTNGTSKPMEMFADNNINHNDKSDKQSTDMVD